MDIDKRTCIIGIGSHNYGAKKFHTICHLQVGNQETQLYTSVPVQRPENHGERSGQRLESLELQRWRAGENWLSQIKKRQNKSALWGEFLFYALNRLDDIRPKWWGQIFFIRSDSNANFLQKHPHRLTQKGFTSWVSLGSNRMTCKINQHK